MSKYTPEELKADVELTYGCLGNEDDHLPEILEMIDENTSLKNQVETLKSLLRTAEEALRLETNNRNFYRGMYYRTKKELNDISPVTNFTDLTER